MSLVRAALKLAAPLPDIEKFERFLFIGPHADDIEIGAGATAAKLASAGKALRFLICTDGRFGGEGEKLPELRRQEAVRSAGILGVGAPEFLGLCDGGFYAYEDLVSGIAKAVGRFQPDIIFAPDPFVGSECHPDHLNTGRAAAQAACLAPYGGIMERLGTKMAPVHAIAFYFTASPNRYVKTKGFFQTQLDSIFSCHKSQFPSGSEEARALALYLRLRSADFGLRSFKGHAEGFRVLGQLQMHCLPEFGQ